MPVSSSMCLLGRDHVSELLMDDLLQTMRLLAPQHTLSKPFNMTASTDKLGAKIKDE